MKKFIVSILAALALAIAVAPDAEARCRSRERKGLFNGRFRDREHRLFHRGGGKCG